MLSYIKLFSTVEIIGEDEFIDCDKLNEVNLSKGLGLMREGSFTNCKSLVHMYIYR